MSSVGPGRHPSFDMTIFTVEHQRVLRRLENLFHLTRHGEVSLGKSSSYQYALIKPFGFVQSLLHTDREVVVLFSPYRDFQPRTIDAFDAAIAQLEDMRVDRVVRILISDDQEIASKLKTLFVSRPDAPVIIPYHHREISLSSDSDGIFSRIREFTFSRDLFSMSSPLRSDLFFYGRGALINEICAKLSAGENFGLFGLRRSGKTSIAHGVARAVQSRGGRAHVIDCSNPSVHQRRWNELLYYIVHQIRSAYSISVTIHSEDKYNTKDAASIFVRDMRSIRGRLRADFIALLFDEVERISHGTASSVHWNADRDALLFWQAIRSGFQSDGAPYTFLIVGTNPSAVERSKLFESDNPLFGNVERRFIPMFTLSQVREMVSELGQIMGLQFDESAISRLYDDFGGHPFLTRYACSFISAAVPSRPVLVDRTGYTSGIVKFKTEASEYVASIVEMVRENYADEYDMMKLLAVGVIDDFEALAVADANLISHLVGYGIVGAGQKAHYFRIGVVESFFEKEARPAAVLDQEDRRTLISQGRNALEQAIRRMIRQCFSVHYPSAKRGAEILKALGGQRRDRLGDATFEELTNPATSPLFFSDLDNLIQSCWNVFQNAIEMPKDELRYHMSVVNRVRRDAHANDIDDDEFDKVRVSLRELKRVFSSEDVPLDTPTPARP